MSQKLISLRVELSKRLADVQVIGSSRELSLATTSIQSARMLFGSVALLLGSTNPYPEADKPASAVIHPSADLAEGYVPPALPAGQPIENQIGYVKALRVELQQAIDAAVALRSQLWARPCASALSITAESLFDRAVVELFLAKQWLGEQLAVIAGHALVKAPKRAPAPVPDAVSSVTRLLETADAKDLAIIAGILVDKLSPIVKQPAVAPVETVVSTGGASSEPIAPPEGADDAPEARLVTYTETAPVVAPEAGATVSVVEPAASASNADEEAADVAAEDKLAAAEKMLLAGSSIALTSRELDITARQVTKVRDRLRAEGKLAKE